MFGLGLSLPQASIKSSNKNQWWAEGASMALDFTANKAMRNGLNLNITDLITCTRATPGTAKDSTGNDITFDINELRITDKGLYIYQADAGTDADNIEFIDINWFDTLLGTFLLEWEQIITGQTRQTLMRWRGLSMSGSNIWSQIRSGNAVIMQLYDNSPAFIFNNGMWSAPNLGVHKIAGAFGADNMALARSASLDANISTSLNGTQFSPSNLVRIGRGATTDSYLNGWLRSITYWPTRLNDTQLQELVS